MKISTKNAIIAMKKTIGFKNYTKHQIALTKLPLLKRKIIIIHIINTVIHWLLILFQISKDIYVYINNNCSILT